MKFKEHILSGLNIKREAYKLLRNLYAFVIATMSIMIALI